ncbi:hypothetical protein BGZ57DRAFT_919780 [Hyaloscypha finlandica]|nr:hypothetical protein BGZ57DRAFT_919780 [Hyaloscypha finlandica]
MDIFDGVVTAATLIASYINACCEFSNEAKSLKVRYDWDLRALKNIRGYFENRHADNAAQQFSPEDTILLRQTSSYLEDLVQKVHKNLGKIDREGWLRDAKNMSLWALRKNELKDMETELFEWTRRFDVRVLGLPPELRHAIRINGGDDATPVVKSNNRLQEFNRLAVEAKQKRGMKMLEQSPITLLTAFNGWTDISFIPVQFEGKQLVFSSRRVSESVVSNPKAFKKLTSDMAVLAAALNCLEPSADVRLLKVEHHFYHSETKQFLFGHATPYQTTSMMTLENMIRRKPFPHTPVAIGQRLKLAQKLAEAVLFLHAAGFLHKNITSSSAVALRKRAGLLEKPPASFVDDVYLMGFDLIRGIDAKTAKEGTVREDTGQPASIWDFEIFMHPDRLRGRDSETFSKTYDVYSVGVVLLEIGLWEPLSKVVEDLDKGDHSTWTGKLLSLAPTLVPRVGAKYQRLVEWCLNLDVDDGISEIDFVQMVLDPLEEMANALS